MRLADHITFSEDHLQQIEYPEIYKYDMEKEVKEFYKLFYNYELKDEEVKEILGK